MLLIFILFFTHTTHGDRFSMAGTCCGIPTLAYDSNVKNRHLQTSVGMKDLAGQGQR